MRPTSSWWVALMLLSLVAPVAEAAVPRPRPAPSASSRDQATSSFRDLGVPSVKEIVLSREQAKAQFEAMQRQSAAEQVARKRRGEVIRTLVTSYARTGVEVRVTRTGWHLIVPTLAKVPVAARPRQARELATRFAREIKVADPDRRGTVAVYLDPGEQQLVKY